MFPWFPSVWCWAPQVHFPWSGAVQQRIEPHTSWFAEQIPPEAGNARIEEQAFAKASYGRQLGLLTEVLIDVAAQAEGLQPQAEQALCRLRALKQEIDAIKQAEYAAAATRLADEVLAVRERGGAEFAVLVQQLRPLLAELAGDEPKRA